MLTMTRYCAKNSRGAALILALIVLVSMLLAGVALMRSVDTSAVIAGNLAFRQATTATGETGIETAIVWLEAHNADYSLYNTMAGSGYVAVRQDPTPALNNQPAQSWDAFWSQTLVPAQQVVTLAADAAGNTVSYIIHRLCNAAGSPLNAGAGCQSSPTPSASTSSKGGSFVSPVSSGQVYYRITVRIDGPRNTLGYVQAVVAM